MKKKKTSKNDTYHGYAEIVFENGEVLGGAVNFGFAASASTCKRAHPVDEFDTLVAAGYKLNLITGEYEK